MLRRACVPPLLLVLLVAACSGTDPGGPPSTTAPTGGTTAPTGGTPLTGLPVGTGTPPSIPPSDAVLPECDYPPQIEMPDWLPGDLPLPEGTYAFEHLDKAGDYHRTLFVVPASLEEIATLVLEEWPKAGYILGRGDAEPGEIENFFTKPPAAGAFKANTALCTPGYSTMLLIYAPVLSTPGG